MKQSPPEKVPNPEQGTPLMLGGTLASRSLGFARDVLLAHILGASADVFLVAFRLPNLFRRLLAEGSLGLACAAAFSREAGMRGMSAARELGRDIFVLVLAFSLPLTLALALAAGPLVFIMAPGLAAEPDSLARAAFLLRCALPYLFFSLLAAVIFSTRAGQGDFRPQAFSSALFNVCMLLAAAAALGMGLDRSWTEILLCCSISLAGAAQLLVLGKKGLHDAAGTASAARREAHRPEQCPFLRAMNKDAAPPGPVMARRAGATFGRAVAAFRKAMGNSPDRAAALFRSAMGNGPGRAAAAFRKAMGNEPARVATARMPLAAFGASVQQLQVLIGVFLASFLGQGGISALYFAERLLEFPLGLAGVAIAVAATPKLAELAAMDRKRDFSETLGQGLCLSLFLGFPAAAGLAGLALPLAWLFFGHGAYGQEEVLITAACLAAYAPAVPAMCAARPLLAALAALGETRAVSVAACQSLLAAALAGLAAMPLGPAGIALGLATASWVNTALLWRILRRRDIPNPLAHAQKRVALYAALAACLFLILYSLPLSLDARAPLAALLALISCGAALLWICSFRAAGNPEAAVLLRLFRR